jgi:2,4-dichlorophenol 6-monooxygenase
LQEGAAVEAALGYEPAQPAEAGWEALSTLYEPGPAGDERRDALHKAIELSNYQFNAHGIELGYRYQSDAIVDDGSPAATPERDPQLYYQATTRPGARVPHARLELGGTPVSSLDLVDDLGFALLTGVGGEAWARVAAETSAQTGIPVRVYVIGGREGVTDPYGEWASLRQVETAGCVLVRPDRHVAWRSMRYPPDSARQLTAVIKQVLGQ